MSALRLLPLALLLLPGAALAQKTFINFSNQPANVVCAGGVESQYAADNASRLEALLKGYGFEVRTSDDFYGSNAAAASWGASSFLSIHSNAGGGHGTVTLKGWYADSTRWSTAVHTGLISKLPRRWWRWSSTTAAPAPATPATLPRRRPTSSTPPTARSSPAGWPRGSAPTTARAAPAP